MYLAELYVVLAVCFHPFASSLVDGGSALHFGPRSPFGGATVNNFATYDDTFIELWTVAGEKLSNTLTIGGHEVSITARVKAFNETFYLLLRRNRLMFSSSYIEKYVTQTAEYVHSVNQVTDHCYYTGRVKQHEHESTVAVSTCNGLTGYFSVDDETYYIEPLSGDVNGRHLVFRESDSVLPPTQCGNQKSVTQREPATFHRKMKRSFEWPQDLDGTTKVVEIYIVNSYGQFIAQNSNTRQVTARTKNILNVVNSLYESQNIYFVLVGVEVWIDSERITIDANNSTATLNNFLTYRKSKINSVHYNDNAQLITNAGYSGGIVGKAPIGSMCTFQLSGGINSDVGPIASHVGTSMAHEIGHNFGLLHDTDVPGCQCNDATGNCIMYPTTIGQNIADQWSSCSNSAFQHSLSHGLDICLKNTPPTLFDSSTYCGNGIIEDGEQCDCGRNPLSSECNSACCNSTTCRLIGSAKCSSGRCCDVASCQLKSQGYECRPANGVCDLSEYCNGANPVCPSDVYKQDSTSCVVNAVSAYCYQGQCRSHQSQCKLLWGSSSDTSDSRCYNTFNVQGSYAGNCGMNWNTLVYEPCSTSDVMCGQLLCWPTNKLVGIASTMVYLTGTAYIGTSNCNSVILDVGTQSQSPGLVPDGAQCGDGKMCLSQKCRDIPSLSLPTCTRNCSGNGVCNSLGQCHCNPGYDPVSDCSKPGAGGSVHSGSPAASSSTTGLVVGLCILFLVILPLLVILSLCGYRHRQKIIRRFQSRNVNSSSGSSQPRRTAADFDISVLSDAVQPSTKPPASSYADHNRNTVQAERPSSIVSLPITLATVASSRPNVSSTEATSQVGSSKTAVRLARPVPPRKPGSPVPPLKPAQATDTVTYRPTRIAPPPPALSRTNLV